MEKTRKIRCFTTFIILIILIIILLIMNVCIGTVHISFKAAFVTLYDHSDRVGRIVWDIRMPRAIAAMILGGALALAGYLLQTFFHNPIAGPFVLGISSGAKMIVALVMVFLLGNAIRVSSLAMIAAAFLGAMLSMGFVLIISRKVSSMSMLVVSGVMIGYICSAVTEFVVTFADDSDIVNLHNWSRGSFSGMTWDSVGVMSIVVGITFIFCFSHVKASYGISARRVICRKSRCKHKAYPGAFGSAFKSAFRMYSGVCGTDIVCRNSRATHSKKHAKEHKAYIYDTGLLPWGSGVLPVL